MGLSIVSRSIGAFVAAGFGVVLLSSQAAAQATYYDTAGRVRATDPFEDDGFKPVWLQQQEKAKRDAAAAAAKRAAEEKRKQQAAVQPASPLRTDTKTFERWTLTCEEFAAGKTVKRTCAAALRVVEGGHLMVVWDIRRGADGKLRSLIQTPTGVQVKTGVEIALGNGTVRKFVYESCSAQNCDAFGPADDAMIKVLQAASEVAFTVRAADGRVVTFKSPVAGAGEALAGARL